MYCDFFGLRCRPFEDRADTQFFFPRADCEEALAAMDYEAHYGKGMSLVLGEAGTGKTLLIRVLLQRLHASDQVVVLPWPSAGQMELLRESAKGFGVSLPSTGHPSRYLSRLRRHLIRARDAQRRSILIIDQAENLAAENIAELETLADLAHGGARLLNITLVGQPHIRSVLAKREFARISQQLFGERFLAPLTREETEEYVRHRLRAAGAGNVDLFESAAIELIQTASNGIPRLVNHMCNAAMLAAYGAREPQVSAAIAAEITNAKGALERSMDAREVGVATAEHVAAGLRSLGQQTGGAEAALSRSAAPAAMASAVASDGGRVATSRNRDEGPDVDGYDPSREPEHVAPGEQTPDEEPALGSARWDGPDEAADSTLTDGVRLMHRLEWVLGRADRVGATTEASLAQFTAVEKHLTALTGSADRQMAKLAEAVQRATGSLENVEHGVDEILGRTEGRMHAITAEITRANEVSTDAEDQTQRLRRASEQAAQAESRLKSFADQLADKVDEVQERIAHLLTSSGAADEARDQLNDVLRRMPSVASETEGKVAHLHAKLQQSIKKGERFQEQFTEAALEAYRMKVEEQLRCHEESSQKTIGSVQHKFDSIVERATAAAAEAEEKAAWLRSTLERTKNEAERFQVQFMETSPRRLKEKLQEQVELCETMGAQAVETAVDKLSKIARQLTKLTEDADHKADFLRATVHETEAEVDRIRSELVDSAVRSAREKLQEQVGLCEKSGTQAVEAAVEKLNQTTTQAAELTDDSSRKIDSLRTALSDTKAEADRIRSELVDSAVRSLREKLQEQVELYEKAGAEAVDAAAEKLNQTATQAAGITGETSRKIDSLRTALDETKAEANRIRSEFVDSAVRNLQEKLQERLDLHLQKQEEKVESFVAAREATLKALVDSFAARVRVLEESTATGRQEIDKTLTEWERTSKQRIAACEQAHDESLGELTARADHLRQNIDALERRRQEVQSSLDPISDGLTTATEKASSLEQSVQEAEASVQDLAKRSDAAVDNLSGTIERGERLLPEALAACGQVEATQRSVSVTLVEIGGATERVHALREEANQCRELTGRLTSAQAAGEKTARQLEETAASADKVLDAVRKGIADAVEHAHRLDSQRTAAGQVVETLGQATVTGKDAAERLDVSTGQAAELREAADDLAKRLTIAQTQGGQTAQQLDELVGSARQAHDAVQGVVAHLDEKFGRLDSHNAAATTTLRSLSEVVETGHHTIERINESSRVAAEAADGRTDRLNQTLANATTMTNRVESGAKEFAAKTAEAGELMERLGGAVPGAERLAAELGDRVRAGEPLAENLTQRCTEAGKLGERLTGVTEVLEKVEEREVSARAAGEHLSSMHEQLLQTADIAGDCGTTLEDLNAIAHDLIETHERVRQETDTATKRLTAQSAATQKSLEAGEPIIREFIAQARKLEQRIQELHGKTSQCEKALGEATSKPAEVIATAQAQAAQLERVCGAVRKVFSGLSQATLDARTHTRQCTDANEQASERLAALSAETDHTATTLHEWVEEASRAQSRLERTLRRCPTIHETHPGDSLRHVSHETIATIPRIANPSVSGELTTLQEPPVPEPPPSESPEEDSVPEPATRAREVSNLIQDAKRAGAGPESIE